MTATYEGRVVGGFAFIATGGTVAEMTAMQEWLAANVSGGYSYILSSTAGLWCLGVKVADKKEAALFRLMFG